MSQTGNSDQFLDPSSKEQLSLLRTEYVWDGFVLFALLEDHNSQGELLLLPHTGPQNHRFDDAMMKCNEFMNQSGQPEWSHFCQKCCRVWPGENGDQPSEYTDHHF